MAVDISIIFVMLIMTLVIGSKETKLGSKETKLGSKEYLLC